MTHGFALVNAEVWTLKSPGDRAQAVVVHNGRIEFVGREDRAQQRARSLDIPIHDVNGARVLPGMVDGHTHLVHQGILSRRVDLWESTSLTAALRKIQAAVRKAKSGELILAERFDESRWKEGKWPALADLDAISREHHIVMRRIDGHIAVGNTLAVERVAQKLRGVDKERGLLVEEASLELHRVYPTPVPHAVEACAAGQQEALRVGVTTVHDFVHPNYFRGWQALDRRGQLHLKVVATTYVQSLAGMVGIGIETRFGNAKLLLGGTKLFADGTIGAHTAALTKEYGDERGNLGRLNYSDGELMEHLDMAQDGNLQISVHAIGDAAIDQILGAMGDLPRKDRVRLRHRIEHFEMGGPEQWAKAMELGLVLSMQPNFLGAWGAKGGMYQKRFSDHRSKETNQFRKMIDDGVQVAFGSDCMPLDPWFGLESVVNAPWPAQRLKIEEALVCYTRNSSMGLHLERDRGTLEKGKAADLVVVDGDWKKKGGIAATQVLATAIDGDIAYQRRKFRTRQ